MSREAWIVIAVVGGIVAVATLIGAILLGVRVWRTRAMLNELGVSGKFAFYGALIYTIFPVDVLPDPIYLDDMGVLAGSLLYLTHLVRKYRATSRATGAGTQSFPPHASVPPHAAAAPYPGSPPSLPRQGPPGPFPPRTEPPAGPLPPPPVPPARRPDQH